MTYSESDWRCPNAKDGAFHVVDMAKLDSKEYTYPCTSCGNRVGFELVNNGMARARGGFVNPSTLPQNTANKPEPFTYTQSPFAVPHNVVDSGNPLKVGGKADMVVSVDKNDDASKFHTLTIGGPNGTLVCIDLCDGKIEYGPNYTPDAAAKIFWEAIGTIAPFVGG